MRASLQGANLGGAYLEGANLHRAHLEGAVGLTREQLDKTSGDACTLLNQQGVDTTTPAGRALFQMLAVFAEFERAIIVERVRAGIARARTEGKHLGRPRINGEMEQAIRSALAEGKGIRKVAKECGVGVSVVQRIKAAG